MVAKQFPIVINSLLMLLMFYYASIQLPVLGLVIGAFMPLPIILTIRRAGWLSGLLLVAAGVGMLFYVEHFAAIKAEVLPFLHMAVIGFAIAFFTLRQYKLEVIVGGTVFLAVTLQVSVFLILAWQHGLTPLAYLQQTVAEIWTLFSQLIEKEPILQQEIQLTGLDLTEFTTRIAQLTPAFLVINSTFGGFVELSAQSEPGRAAGVCGPQAAPDFLGSSWLAGIRAYWRRVSLADTESGRANDRGKCALGLRFVLFFSRAGYIDLQF